MITALYAALLALLMMWLAVQVIKQRRKNRVAYADGGIEGLQIARSAQGNAVDSIPITVILLALLEFNGANVLLIHGLGILFLVGRIVHARAILAQDLKGRVMGMKLTFATMFALVVLNLIYLPFDKLW
ncbi:glutathione S-transferase-related protein [Vibrio ichthyoenteri ATCC 700023]|uniref:Glutathione S-transferase-related protein n=1 Tax=Vibrio ichthyoenteri ATCC 700023 TaxID=870968 RepID=F9RZS8_9VIBR|nr:MAPEG family protein [Vibrio ichthyoenteri]EGU44336.1 glutathione S-transferase-related protein [Vibrio ichthyoenteri ATCC 700023]